MGSQEVRIDKWLWATRIFKTRSIAAEACKKGRIMIKDVPVKPSRTVKVGDVLQIKKPPVTYSFKILQLTERRMGAKLVPEFIEDVTPPEQYQILELDRINGFINRSKGTGRPTKKERREIDSFIVPQFMEDFDFDEED
ncbi:MAG: RNA-binding S4 domain-containing protein [Candidatus Azobacteroides sp.]|nr:RNA-binding S4 domain-containing protein [Candidatus Azobacteroides sp.]